jgi:protein-tyrosine kinase
MTKQSNTDNDICASIHSPDNVDPFEGLDLNEICVSPTDLNSSGKGVAKESKSAEELFGLNPLDGINLKDISVNLEKISSSPQARTVEEQQPHQDLPLDDVNFLIMPQEDAPSESQKYKRPTRSLTNDVSQPPVKLPQITIHPIIEKAHHYAELTQIRQKIFASLEKTGGKTLLIASPLDNTGSSLLAAALAYNTACSCQQSVLLIDCNMRRAGLHDFFYVPQSYGFTDLIQKNLPWQAVVKETSISGLNIITAGDPVENFSDFLRYAHIPRLVENIRNEFDLIIFDTSPILRPNRNNINIVSLTAVTDYFLLVTKQAGTTKHHLKETKDIVEAGNGKIDGIVINEHSPNSKPSPYKK